MYAQQLVAQPSTATTTAYKTANNTLRENCEELICSICTKYLSIPPIFIRDNGKTNVCGRCQDQSADTTLLRNETYEKLAKNMQFPCSESKNCTEVLDWGKVSEHENICPFRVVECPHSNCVMIYEISNLLTHFRNNHKIYLGHAATHNFIFGKPDVILIDARECLFLGFMTTDTDFLYINIVTFSTQETKYKFRIGFNTNVCNIDYSSGHSIGVYPGKYISSIFTDAVRIKKQSLADVLLLTKPLCGLKIKLEIFEANKSKSTQLSFTKSCCKDIVINALECPICFGMMNSSILLCRAGHSICASCKPKTSICPTCRAPFQNGRNYALEAIYQKFQLVSYESITDDYFSN